VPSRRLRLNLCFLLDWACGTLLPSSAPWNYGEGSRYGAPSVLLAEPLI
jgi:hypothetical protein